MVSTHPDRRNFPPDPLPPYPLPPCHTGEGGTPTLGETAVGAQIQQTLRGHGPPHSIPMTAVSLEIAMWF